MIRSQLHSLFRLIVFCAACYLLWQAVLTINVLVAPNLPFFPPLVLLGWWLIARWGLRGEWTEQGVLVHTRWPAYLYCISVLVASILISLLQLRIVGAPSLRFPPNPEGVSSPFATTFQIMGPVLLGMTEEFVFRGILQRSLTVLLGKWTAWIVVAVLFVIAHTMNGYFRFQFAFYAYVALALGYLALRSRSVVPSLLVHASLNFTLNVYVAFNGTLSVRSVSSSRLTALIGSLAISTMLTILAATRSWRVEDTASRNESVVQA